MENKGEIIQHLHTVRDYWRLGISEFNRAGLHLGHGTDNAGDEALYLISHVLAQTPVIDDALLDTRLTPVERAAVIDIFRRRIDERVPAAYLTGEAWFAGLRFQVDPRVLVPRSPIAELIGREFEPWLGGRPPADILDLCTGSGCIGIACAYAFPEAAVDLADISPDAIAVAEHNIRLHGVQGRVKAHRADLFDGLNAKRYDLIVSNPPYVDAEDLSGMPAEYRAEPAIGLGSGADGLDITRRILAQAPAFLRDGGLLVVEVGNSALALERAFPDVAFTWLEFEHGGHGVFALYREQLPL